MASWLVMVVGFGILLLSFLFFPFCLLFIFLFSLFLAYFSLPLPLSLASLFTPREIERDKTSVSHHHRRHHHISSSVPFFPPSPGKKAKKVQCFILAPEHMSHQNHSRASQNGFPTLFTTLTILLQRAEPASLGREKKERSIS